MALIGKRELKLRNKRVSATRRPWCACRKTTAGYTHTHTHQLVTDITDVTSCRVSSVKMTLVLHSKMCKIYVCNQKVVVTVCVCVCMCVVTVGREDMF